MQGIMLKSGYIDSHNTNKKSCN